MGVRVSTGCGRVVLQEALIQDEDIGTQGDTAQLFRDVSPNSSAN